MFIWRCCQNVLPVNETLFKKKIRSSPICPICKSEIETVEHTLLLWPWTSLVWFGSQLQCTPSVDNITNVAFWLQQLMTNLQGNKQFFNYGMSLLIHTLWMIWKSRNDFIFRNKLPNQIMVINKAKAAASECLGILPEEKSGGSPTSSSK